MEHPCYGLVPAILTLDAIKEGVELTVHYQMDMEVIYLGNQNHFSSLSGCARLVPSVLGGGEHKDLVSLKGSLSCKHLLAEILIDRY